MQIHNSKLLASTFCLGIVLLFACKGKTKEQGERSASTIPEQHSNVDSLKDNEVKAEAPDTKVKTEQGYALPSHSAKLSQSPINIVTDKTDKDASQKFSFAFHSDINAVENLGHTIQVDFKSGSTCTINGKDYVAKQFHFHTPSEHLIDGMTFPMEMHMVNALVDSSNPDKTSVLVVGILFKIGAENKFIKEFLDKIPGEEEKKNELQTSNVRLADLLSQFGRNELQSYYSYKGSLTTPPFSENVQWVVLKHTLEASEDQIITIEKMEGNNARHVQATNDRKVYSQ